tara:strand:+ start:1002 stop:1214 length:213 start_codon:yes stop_codon:yes gene_type:complete
MPSLLVCESLDDGVCVNASTIEVSQASLDYLDQYQVFVEDYYFLGFSSVLGLFIAGLSVGIIINIVRKLK